MGKTIVMGHGSGGLMTGELIRNLFCRHFSNTYLDALTDSAVFLVNGKHLALTTDSYVVDPVFFPGGNIGKLAVCGTVNDLSVSGALPLFLSAAFILEEGFPLSDLETITKSMGDAAREAGVAIVTGDTKVVRKGQCDGIFINTAGVGTVEDRHLHISAGKRVSAGDLLIVNGYLGDHEIAILSAREKLSFEEPVVSDVASLNALVHAVLAAETDVRFMRDITRGGLATILAELAASRGVLLEAEEKDIPVREAVKGICEIFGFDPLYLANEGKLLMVVPESSASSVLSTMHGFTAGKDAAVIGRVAGEHTGMALLHSVSGGKRILQQLAGEQLPRIC